MFSISKYIKIALFSLVAALFVATPVQSYFNSGGGEDPGDGDPAVIEDFTVDFNPDTNDLTIDVEVDVDATIGVYYSSFTQVDSDQTSVSVGDDGQTTLYLGSCSETECTPEDVRRIVVKVQQNDYDTVLVKRVEVDADGNESIFSSYTDTTTELSEEELAWLLEIVEEEEEDDLEEPSPTPSPSPSVSPSPSPTASPTPSTSPSPTPTSNPSDDSSSGSDSSGSSGSSTGSTSPASPQVCGAATPTTVSNLQITSQSANGMILSWNAASPVTHYALIFTRTSDGAAYGASNIGNVTSYQIEGISGQASYTFEVFAVNDCQPGERASVTSSTFSGPVIETRPSGQDGQVLGATTEEESSEGFTVTSVVNPSPSPQPTVSERNPQVLGETVCSIEQSYLPVGLLILLLGIAVAIELILKKDTSMTPWLLAIGATVGVTGLFYLVGKCDCEDGSLLSMICSWFWLITFVIGASGRGVGLLVRRQTTSKKKK